jgi:hypothetical protein
MLWMRDLIFGPLSATPVSLSPLIFDAHFNPFGEGLWGRAAFTGVQERSANFKQPLTLASFSITNQRQVVGGVDHPDQSPDGAPEQLVILTATLKLPQEAGSPVHKHNRPAFTELRCQVFLPGCRAHRLRSTGEETADTGRTTSGWISAHSGALASDRCCSYLPQTPDKLH